MRIAFLTAGGIAPCLSASIGRLIKNYSEKDKSIEMIGYLYGYKGLLMGESVEISQSIIDSCEILYNYGGTPLGNSRVKLSNIEDCIKNNYIKENENPLEIAAKQLVADGIDILHTIGGDDTNSTAGELVQYLSISWLYYISGLTSLYIHKIDKLNLIVVPKSNLGKNFSEFNELK